MSAPRKRRADAEHNRERIVQSACRIYREMGPGAPLDAIATEAGVGNATLYRHFPSRSDLRTSVLAARLHEVEDFLTELEGETDAWAGVERYVRYLASTPDNTLVEVLVAPAAETFGLREYREKLRQRVRSLLGRAQDAGVLREDYTVDDMNVFLFAHTKVTFSPHIDAAAAGRLLDDYLAGIHAVQRPARRAARPAT